MIVIECPGSEWIVKLGPVSKVNVAGGRKAAEEGAALQIRETVTAVMAMAKDMVPLLQQGAVCAGDCGTPEAREVEAKPSVWSIQLPDGKWFSMASSGVFGYQLVCRRADE